MSGSQGALGESRPRCPLQVRIDHYPGWQGRLIFLLIYLFSRSVPGSLASLQQPPLCSSFSAAFDCLINVLSGFFGWSWSLCSPASLVAQTIKRLPAMPETWVRSLGWEDPLEKEMATHSSTLAWKIPWTEEPGGLQSMESKRVGHD